MLNMCAANQQPDKATEETLSHVRAKWDHHPEYTSAIPTINFVIHEAVEPIEDHVLKLMNIAKKAYSIPQSGVESLWKSFKEKITMMAQDAIKIGMEIKYRSGSLSTDLAWNEAAHLLVAARYNLAKEGVRLIQAASKKKKLSQKDPRIAESKWAKDLLECQKTCFDYGYSLIGINQQKP
jgi:hypothetical protein